MIDHANLSEGAQARRRDPIAQLALTPGSFSRLFGDSPDWRVLRRLAHAATSPTFAGFFRSQPTGRAAPCLEDPDHATIAAACAAFCSRFVGVHRRSLAALVARLAEATCPHPLPVSAKVLHGDLTAWMYALDDGVLRWSSRWSDKDWYPRAVRSLVEHQLDCFQAGLRADPLPVPPLSERPYFDGTEGEWYALFGTGRALYECADQLGRLAPDRITRAAREGELAWLTRALESSLRAKVDEAYGAPDNPEQYLVRHAKTGHVQVCLELNLLCYAWWRGTTRTEVDAVLPERWGRAIERANHAVLRSNELCFVKDIGQSEESLLAVTIAALRKDAGSPLGMDLTTGAGHGRILAAHAASRWGLLGMRRIIGDLREDLSILVATAAQMARQARGAQEALAVKVVNTTLLTWAFGYHFLNPISGRYGGSYPVLLAALEGELPRYLDVLGQAIAGSPCTEAPQKMCPRST